MENLMNTEQFEKFVAESERINSNYIGRFENFETDLLNIFNIININKIKITKHNVSKNRLEYRKYYDSYLRDKVGNIYQKDINLFSYKF